MATFKPTVHVNGVYEDIDETKIEEHVYLPKQDIENSDNRRQRITCCQKAVCHRGTCTLIVCVVGFVSLSVIIFSRTPVYSSNCCPKKKSVEEMNQEFLSYSLLGYNILRGFPLALGHDPGFTFPIFNDSNPGAIFHASDVSCEKSFSSKIIQTRTELASFLSRFVLVSGDKWGRNFFGNTEYKTLYSQIDSGEFVFIFSSVTCISAFSKIMKRIPVNLHANFLTWVDALGRTNDKETYFEFFDTFGTHFPTMITYGARYTYQHKMTLPVYTSKRANGIKVAIQASHFSDLSIGGRGSMDSTQTEQALQFSSSVETKSITVGTPPPSKRDTVTWASEVMTKPMPISYELKSMEYLFTDNFISEKFVNKSRIVANIRRYQYEYCLMLKKRGKTNSCSELNNGIELYETKFSEYHITINSTSTFSECMDHCIRNTLCTAVTYCTSCARSDISSYQVCFLFKGDKLIFFDNGLNGWTSGVLLNKVRLYLSVNKTAILGTPMELLDPRDDSADFNSCLQVCLSDTNCVAFSFCECPDTRVSCKIYDGQNIIGLKADDTASSYFVSR